MKSTRYIKLCFASTPALLLVLLVGVAGRAFAGWDYGNGRHGYFVLTTNATIEQLYQTVRLPSDLAQYNPTNSDAIPNFQGLTITNGATLTANPWDGSAGGKIVLKVEATLSVAAGSAISANGIGYRGGGNLQQGESFNGTGVGSQTANFGGGGGGYLMPNGYYTSAGGGGYATGGGTGGGNPYTTYNSVDYSGVGGGTYGDQSLTTIYLGSGGGGGSVQAPPPYSYPFTGGGGGGMIVINAGNLVVGGPIQANGGLPHYDVGGSVTIRSSGGGGSGGSIVLRAKTATLGANQITATGGNGSGNGGSGGVGRITVEYFGSVIGSTTPSAYTLQDTNSDNITTITSQPATQTNFWSSNAVMTVGITGYPPFVFQWYFNSTPISGATNQNLTLTSLDFTNQGNYSVTVSNAVMTVASSNAFLTVLDGRDFDGDGIPNYWELQYGLDQNNPNDATNHPSGDPLTYLQKYFYGLNPTTLDTDDDGLTDYDELFVYGTNPLKANTSGDGIPDGWKVQHGLNPLAANANDEVSSSGVSYLQVYQYNLSHTNQLDPRQPFFASGSGIYELLNGGQGTNRMYYDRNDRLVGAEYSRGVSIAYKYDGNDNPVRQTYLSRTNETNGLPVLWRFLNGLTNNTSPFTDSDGDGWTDYQEWEAGSNPRDALSTPNLLGNPGTNIASLTLPFTPSNFVVGVGQLDGYGAEEIVIGGDGNPGTNSNFLLVLTQEAVGWSTQRVDVGSFGITSIAVGQPTNRPNAGIYVGLRGTNGTGQVMEFTKSGGIWQTNTLAVATNPIVFVLGIRSTDLLACYSPTNGPDGALYSLSYTNGLWNQSLLNTNGSHRIAGAVGLVAGGINRQAGFRLLDGDGIEVSDIGKEFLNNRSLIPSNSVYYSESDKWYFLTATNITWDSAKSACEALGGELVTITSSNENQWVHSMFPFQFHIGLYVNLAYVNNNWAFTDWHWASGSTAQYRNWAAGQPNVPWFGVGENRKDTSMLPDGTWSILNSYSVPLTGLGDMSSAGGRSTLPEASVWASPGLMDTLGAVR